MTSRRALLGLTGLAAALAACGSPPPPPPAPPMPVRAPVAAAPSATTPVPPGAPAQPGQPPALVPPAPDVPQPPTITYEPKGRRDPFVTLEATTGPTGLQVVSTKLTGIVRGAKTTLALVETAEGIGYILKPGDTLGDGRLIEIGADSVVFQVTPRPGSTTNRVVLTLAAK